MTADEWTHIAYPKIIERIDALGLDERQMRATRAGRYVAREKIHGANFALHTDGASVRASRRKRWLTEDEHEACFHCGALLRSLREPVLAVYRALGVRDAQRVVVFGELFGGRYPHPRVAADPRYSAVQTGVWYAPSLAFAVFDVAIVGEGDALAFVGADEVDALCAAASMMAAPVVARGRLSDVLAVTLPFATRVPAMLGLPALEDNLAEGVVITAAQRPSRALLAAPRLVIKRKIDRFAEDERFGLAQPPARAAPYASLFARVTPARVAAAWSKIADVGRVRDEAFIEALRDLVVVDVLDAWRADKPHLAHAVHDRSEPFVTLRALCEQAARELLRDRGGE